MVCVFTSSLLLSSVQGQDEACVCSDQGTSVATATFALVLRFLRIMVLMMFACRQHTTAVALSGLSYIGSGWSDCFGELV